MSRPLGPIGVFDSGVGGISTLAALTRELPGENFLYYGDTRNAPYGTKTTGEVLACVRRVVDRLMAEDIKALVIACNTATGAAAAALRRELTLPVIGMEPALKPAEEAWQGGHILVMATPLTLRQEKFLDLMDRFGAHAVPLPCPGLMELVEKEDDAGARAYLSEIFSAWDLDRVDAVVLGCTHYVFLKPMIRRMLPARILLTDGNAGTARQLRRVLRERNLLLPDSGQGTLRMETSGDAEALLPVMRRLYQRAQLIET
ncbi:MAG: glutamate racemase [Clostridia bacterium]|nr:glutamate racemase [Clostridia bacterium]